MGVRSLLEGTVIRKNNNLAGPSDNDAVIAGAKVMYFVCNDIDRHDIENPLLYCTNYRL